MLLPRADAIGPSRRTGNVGCRGAAVGGRSWLHPKLSRVGREQVPMVGRSHWLAGAGAAPALAWGEGRLRSAGRAAARRFRAILRAAHSAQLRSRRKRRANQPVLCRNGPPHHRRPCPVPPVRCAQSSVWRCRSDLACRHAGGRTTACAPRCDRPRASRLFPELRDARFRTRAKRPGAGNRA